MILNGVMAVQFAYLVEFGCCWGILCKNGLLTINRFSFEKCYKVYTNYKHYGRAVLFAVAELVVL